MGQLRMFGQNIVLIMGGLLLLAFGSVMLAVVYTALRVWIFCVLQRRSERAYRRRTRRADGKMYPPVSRGICEACGRTSTHIYYPASGQELCAPCYEEFWRRTEMAHPPTAERPREFSSRAAASEKG